MVGIIMGSDSDLPIMQEAIDILESFDIQIEVDIVSAHRTPEKLFDYSKNAHRRGIKVIIAGAGGAAHLPGMVASLSPLPIIGVPVKSRNSIDGWDSVLSILQIDGVTPHIYGKKITKPFRKMGHVTIVNKDINKARKVAQQVKKIIKVISK